MQHINKLLSTKWYLLTFVITFVVALSAIITLSTSVEQQSLLEQKSITPAIDLITKEIIKPLYIAETIARASPLKLRMNDKELNQQKIVSKLATISKEFDMEFFVASEKSRIQYNSDGSTQALIDGKVEWYFRAKQTEHDIVAALGNINDIRIYYDLKIFNDNNEFLGFIGVSKKLDTFITAFEEFKSEYGYDFVFVDHDDNIVLSSDRSLVADGKRILKMQQLPWYQAFEKQQDKTKVHNNMVINVDGDDLLIAEANLAALKWKFFLVNPLQARQNDTTLEFIMLAIYILFPIVLLMTISRVLLPYLQEEFAKRHQIDPLTKLPNRAQLNWKYQKAVVSQKGVSAIMIDIDHFKKVNDVYGHKVGDLAIQHIAKLLSKQLRDKDMVGRWGGEEFVILLPTTDIDVAYDVAQRARVSIANSNLNIENHSLTLTASFGVATQLRASKLENIVEAADKALYQAKKAGRNTVCKNTEVNTITKSQPLVMI